MAPSLRASRSTSGARANEMTPATRKPQRASMWLIGRAAYPGPPDADLDRHDGVGAPAGVPADHPAAARAGARGRSDRARLRADARAAGHARDRAHGVRPP